MVYGPDLKIPYAATAFVTKRSAIAKRPQVMGRFMRAMGEAAKILHSDKEFVYKVMGKQLRLTDRAFSMPPTTRRSRRWSPDWC